MSTEANIKLFERAAELIDLTLNHPAGVDKALIDAINEEDLDELKHAITRAEAVLAQEHFNNYDLVGQNDIY